MSRKKNVDRVVLHEGDIYDETTVPSRVGIPPTLVWTWMPQMTPPCWGFKQATEEEKIANSPQWYKERACFHAAEAKKKAEAEAREAALNVMFKVAIPTSEEIFTVEVPA
jgi:hypothetical protein